MAKRAVTPEVLFELKFVDAVVPSPDGSRAVYEIKTIDKEKDDYQSHLWLISLTGFHVTGTLDSDSLAAP